MLAHCPVVSAQTLGSPIIGRDAPPVPGACPATGAASRFARHVNDSSQPNANDALEENRASPPWPVENLMLDEAPGIPEVRREIHGG